MERGITILLAVAAAGLLVSIAPASAQGMLPAAIKDAGVLRVATDVTFPPMNYKDTKTGDFVGVGVELMKAVADKLGVKLELVETAYPALMPGLETGRFDMIGAAMVDFPDRREKLSFVDYIKTGPQVFTRLENKDSIAASQDLCGKSVAHVSFVASYGVALKDYSDNNCVPNNKPAIEITKDDLPVQIGLVQSRFDAATVTAESVTYVMQTEPDTYFKVGTPLRTWHYGLAFKKEDTGMRDAVAAAVQAVIDEGTYGEILKKHGIAEQAIDKVMIDSGQF